MALRPVFFELPVYRVPRNRYYADRDRAIEKQIFGKHPKEIEANKAHYAEYPDSEARFRNTLEENYGGPWEFNDVVGYVRLYFLGSQIRGELWMVDATRIARRSRKPIRPYHWKVVPEIEIPRNSTNGEIFAIVSDYVAEAKKELHPRFLDTSTFEITGRHIDWRALWSALGKAKGG